MYSNGSLWVPMDAMQKIQRINPATAKIQATIDKKVPYEAGNPKVVNELVWVTSLTGGVSAFDPRTNSSVYRIEQPTADVVYGADHYWIDDALNNLLRLDPETGEPTYVPLSPYDGRIEDHPNALSYAADSVWVGLGDRQVLFRVEPTSLSILATFEGLGSRAMVRSVGGKTIVFSNDGQIHDLDTRTNTVVRSVRVAKLFLSGRPDLIQAPGRVWINYGSVVYSLDPETLEVLAAYDVKDVTWGIAFVDGTLWIPFYEQGAVRKFDIPAA